MGIRTVNRPGFPTRAALPRYRSPAGTRASRLQAAGLTSIRPEPAAIDASVHIESTLVSVPAAYAAAMRPTIDSRSRWWLWLGLSTLLGLAVRIAAVLGRPNATAHGDSYIYHDAANLLVSGHGFISPYYYSHAQHLHVQSAAFPPLFILLVAIPSVVGLKTFFAERVFCCFLGAAAIVVCGYTGREIAGRRVGLIAAFLLAVYPNIWMSDERAISETIAPLLVATVLLFAYRFWKDPGVARAIWLGVSLGLTILGRDEFALLVLFILVPLVLLARSLDWRQRLTSLGVGVLAVVLVIGPWVGFNLSRFQKPVLITNGLGVTLASADCATTFAGPNEGYWSGACALADAKSPSVKSTSDESVQSAAFQKLALDYVRAHPHRLLPVSMAKIGRAFGFFHPMEQIRFDWFLESRPYRWAVTGLFAYYALLALSIGGTVVLRRRRIPSFPLWAIGLNVVCSVLLTFGNTRYRTGFEVSLVLLAAVQLEWIWAHVRGDSQSQNEEVPEPGFVEPSRVPTPIPASAGGFIQPD